MAGSNNGLMQVSLHLQYRAFCLLLFLEITQLPERLKGDWIDASLQF